MQRRPASSLLPSRKESTLSTVVEEGETSCVKTRKLPIFSNGCGQLHFRKVLLDQICKAISKDQVEDLVEKFGELWCEEEVAYVKSKANGVGLEKGAKFMNDFANFVYDQLITRYEDHEDVDVGAISAELTDHLHRVRKVRSDSENRVYESFVRAFADMKSDPVCSKYDGEALVDIQPSLDDETHREFLSQPLYGPERKGYNIDTDYPERLIKALKEHRESSDLWRAIGVDRSHKISTRSTTGSSKNWLPRSQEIESKGSNNGSDEEARKEVGEKDETADLSGLMSDEDDESESDQDDNSEFKTPENKKRGK